MPTAGRCCIDTQAYGPFAFADLAAAVALASLFQRCELIVTPDRDDASMSGGATCNTRHLPLRHAPARFAERGLNDAGNIAIA